MTDSNFIDSSIWLEYFFNNNYGSILENNISMISILSLFEVKKKLMKEKANDLEIAKCLGFMKNRSIIIPVSIEIAENAASISQKKSIPAIDSLIYASAILKKSILITKDNDFRGLDNVKILD
jgi:predicted nucleic acid-binding protein